MAASPFPKLRPVPLHPLYQCQVVHPLDVPKGIRYDTLPFHDLLVGDVYDVLAEGGHPSEHPDIPIRVGEREEYLLLLRDTEGKVGWGLASFLWRLE